MASVWWVVRPTPPAEVFDPGDPLLADDLATQASQFECTCDRRYHANAPWGEVMADPATR